MSILISFLIIVILAHVWLGVYAFFNKDFRNNVYAPQMRDMFNRMNIFDVGETMRERAKRQMKELIKTSTDKYRENVLTMAYDGYTYDDMISYVLIDGNGVLSSDSINESLQPVRQQCGDNYESYRKIAKIVVDSILKGE